MSKIIEFFLDRPRLNYLLLFVLLIIGISTYRTMPKEIFPPMALDKIVIRGAYTGTSPDILDKMAVANIEDKISGISGIIEVESIVVAGGFNIVLSLDKSFEKDEILNRVKDSVSLAKKDLPVDMNEPSSSFLEISFPLILVNISSDILPYDTLVKIAKEFKTDLSQIKI